MANIELECSCSNKVIAQIEQSYINGGMTWYLSYRCAVCKVMVEEDGGEILPDEIRNEILSQEGVWELKILENDKQSLLKLYKFLRVNLNISLQEIYQIKKIIPGVILKGTKVEVELIYTKLVSMSIKSEIKLMEN